MNSKKFDQELLKITVKENYDRMMNIIDLLHQAKINYVINDKAKPYLRKAFALGFVKACKDFNSKGYVVKIESVYRDINLQKELFLGRCSAIQCNYPRKNIMKIKEMANIFTAGIPIIAAHTAGAAIDITLLDMNYNSIDFGCDYRNGTSKSHTNFKKLTKKQRDNRKIMVATMYKYNIINYPYEYWHFSYGDICWALLLKKKFSIYKPVEFNPATNTSKYLPLKQCYNYF